jgi:Fe-Mn family superoxide dismutase
MKTQHITLTLLLAGLMGMPYILNAQITSQSFVFQDLPYQYDALEPYIDATTMEIHYSRHHRAYYNNFLKAVKDTEMEKMDIEDIFANISTYSPAVRNNGGGYYNHTLFWANMTPDTGGKPSGKLEKALEKTFGSIDAFKELFSEAGATRFGSGWAWLSLDSKGNLFVSSTPNQDNPMMDVTEQRGIPLLAMDVWEHAYYLKYQNKRADYIEAFWNVINWKEVETRYEKALKQLK